MLIISFDLTVLGSYDLCNFIEHDYFVLLNIRCLNLSCLGNGYLLNSARKLCNLSSLSLNHKSWVFVCETMIFSHHSPLFLIIVNVHLDIATLCNNCPCNLSGYYRLHRIHQIKKLSICLWCASVSSPHPTYTKIHYSSNITRENSTIFKCERRKYRHSVKFICAWKHSSCVNSSFVKPSCVTILCETILFVTNQWK